MSRGILYRYSWEADCQEPKLIVPQHKRERIMKEYHDDPTAVHYGVERTYARISKKYYFTGMKRYMTDYIKNCVECQRYKASNQKPVRFVQTLVYAQRFEILSKDLFGPLPESEVGKMYIYNRRCLHKMSPIIHT